MLALTASELGLYIVGGVVSITVVGFLLLVFAEEIAEFLVLWLVVSAIGFVGVGICALLIEVGVLSGW